MLNFRFKNPYTTENPSSTDMEDEIPDVDMTKFIFKDIEIFEFNQNRFIAPKGNFNK